MYLFSTKDEKNLTKSYHHFHMVLLSQESVELPDPQSCPPKSRMKKLIHFLNNCLTTEY